MVVPLMGPGLAIAVLQEHLDASAQQVLPAWTHGGSQRTLVYLDQLAWFRDTPTE